MNLSATLRRSETCVTGFALGLLSYFGIADRRRERLADYLLREQMPDDGWNCRRDQGATHRSFHTTANVLDGLSDYGRAEQAEARGREFAWPTGCTGPTAPAPWSTRRCSAWPAPLAPGAVWFELERPGEPSRWNTLRALRVPRWFDDS